MSIQDNLTFGPELHETRRSGPIPARMEMALKAAYLWDEVKDRLDMAATNLSGGQQQRLCSPDPDGGARCSAAG